MNASKASIAKDFIQKTAKIIHRKFKKQLNRSIALEICIK